MTPAQLRFWTSRMLLAQLHYVLACRAVALGDYRMARAHQAHSAHEYRIAADFRSLFFPNNHQGAFA